MKELVLLSKINKTENKIFAKVENDNPTGSIKDKTVFTMLNEYKKMGKLTDGCVVIEATSGNTGISLAYYASIFNYKCIIVMPDSMSIERRNMIAKYGAELILVEGGMKECSKKVDELLKEIPNSFVFDQFNSKNNLLAHYLTTGPEIFDSNKNIDYIFAGIGTGGTISGIGKYFKEVSLNTKIIGIEPEESPLITKGYANGHLIQGIGANFIPNSLELQYVDEVITVKGEESIKAAKEIRNIENIDIGISSGCSYLGAINYLEKNNIINKNVVVIFPDKGDRYSW